MLEGALRFALIGFGVVRAIHADGVDDGVGVARFGDGVGQSVVAEIVFAVGDHQQNFFVLVSFFQMVERADHRVVERGASARVDALERGFHLLDVAGEIVFGVEVVVVVEIHHEGFVLRIGSLHEGKRCRVHLRPFVAHAAAIVDHQTHADRHVLLLEDR